MIPEKIYFPQPIPRGSLTATISGTVYEDCSVCCSSYLTEQAMRLTCCQKILCQSCLNKVDGDRCPLCITAVIKKLSDTEKRENSGKKKIIWSRILEGGRLIDDMPETHQTGILPYREYAPKLNNHSITPDDFVKKFITSCNVREVAEQVKAADRRGLFKVFLEGARYDVTGRQPLEPSLYPEVLVNLKAAFTKHTGVSFDDVDVRIAAVAPAPTSSPIAPSIVSRTVANIGPRIATARVGNGPAVFTPTSITPPPAKHAHPQPHSSHLPSQTPPITLASSPAAPSTATTRYASFIHTSSSSSSSVISGAEWYPFIDSTKLYENHIRPHISSSGSYEPRILIDAFINLCSQHAISLDRGQSLLFAFLNDSRNPDKARALGLMSRFLIEEYNQRMIARRSSHSTSSSVMQTEMTMPSMPHASMPHYPSFSQATLQTPPAYPIHAPSTFAAAGSAITDWYLLIDAMGLYTDWVEPYINHFDSKQFIRNFRDLCHSNNISSHDYMTVLSIFLEDSRSPERAGNLAKVKDLILKEYRESSGRDVLSTSTSSRVTLISHSSGIAHQHLFRVGITPSPSLQSNLYTNPLVGSPISSLPASTQASAPALYPSPVVPPIVTTSSAYPTPPSPTLDVFTRFGLLGVIDSIELHRYCIQPYTLSGSRDLGEIIKSFVVRCNKLGVPPVNRESLFEAFINDPKTPDTVREQAPLLLKNYRNYKEDERDYTAYRYPTEYDRNYTYTDYTEGNGLYAARLVVGENRSTSTQQTSERQASISSVAMPQTSARAAVIMPTSRPPTSRIDRPRSMQEDVPTPPQGLYTARLVSGRNSSSIPTTSAPIASTSPAFVSSTFTSSHSSGSAISSQDANSFFMTFAQEMRRANINIDSYEKILEERLASVSDESYKEQVRDLARRFITLAKRMIR